MIEAEVLCPVVKFMKSAVIVYPQKIMAGGKGGGGGGGGGRDYTIINWSKTIILVVFLQREVHFYSLTYHGIQK